MAAAQKSRKTNFKEDIRETRLENMLFIFCKDSDGRSSPYQVILSCPNATDVSNNEKIEAVLIPESCIHSQIPIPFLYMSNYLTFLQLQSSLSSSTLISHSGLKFVRDCILVEPG